MLLAVLQGASELFPVSSLGHTVLVPALLHWHFDRTDPTFLAFVVALHLGTAVALVAFYFGDWVADRPCPRPKRGAREHLGRAG